MSPLVRFMRPCVFAWMCVAAFYVMPEGGLLRQLIAVCLVIAACTIDELWRRLERDMEPEEAR